MPHMVQIKGLFARFRYVLAALFSFLTCIGVHVCFFGEENRLFSNSFVAFVLFAALIPVYAFVLGQRDGAGEHPLRTGRMTLCALSAGLILSVCMVFGRSVSTSGAVAYRSARVWGNVLALWPLFAFLIAAFFLLLPVWNRQYCSSALNRKGTIRPDWKSFCITWGIVILCWLPVFLAAYPGVFRYDAPYQIDPVTVNGTLSAKHPVIHTAFLLGSLLLGNRLFGSYEAGMALYSLIQMLALSAIFAFACHSLARRNAPRILQVLAIAYFALTPFHAVMAVTATKDTLFAGFFLLAVLFTADLAADPKRFCSSRFEMIRYVLTLVSMCMWRNNGIYILVIFLPVMILALKKYWKNLLILSLAAVLIYFAYAGPFTSLIGAVPGNSREALSVPMQQMARAAMDAPDQLTEEELSNIHALISENTVQAYNPRISDPVKSGFRTSELFRSPLRYFKTYLTVGMKCPGIYLDAFLNLSLGNWYPDMVYPDASTGHQYIEYEDWTQLYEKTRSSDRQIIPQRESKLPVLDDWLDTYSLEVTQQEIPVLSMLISTGFIFFLIVIAGAAILCFRRYRKLLPLLLMLGLWGTVMLGPIALFRYSYPLMVCTPFLIQEIWECGAPFKREE